MLKALKACAALVALLLSLWGTLVAAQETATVSSRIDDAIAVMQGKREAAEVFSETFLQAVSPGQLKALGDSMTASAGPITGASGIEQSGWNARFTMEFERASAAAMIVIDPNAPHLISGLRIFAVTPREDSLDKIKADFLLLEGRSGFEVARLQDGNSSTTTLSSLNPQQPFAIGSTFKLYVLSALARQVAEGKRHWDDIVPVSGKSFPGGTIHGWPDGAPVTLHTLASLMISISDNTATDMLVREVGQKALEREVRLARHSAPETMLPVLTTAQLFALKAQGLEAAAAYSTADTARRADILASLDTSDIAEVNPGTVFGHGPVAIDQVEWFASPDDLVNLAISLRDAKSPQLRQIMAINPALDPERSALWSYVGYKGGSEDGVISMTWLLEDKAGTWFAITGSWNDTAKAVDNKTFEALMLRLVAAAGHAAAS